MTCACCPCCCIDGVLKYGATVAQCSSCRLNGATVSAADKADCENQGACTLNGSGVSAADQADCESQAICTLNGVTVSSTGQSDCESKTYGHCVQDGATTEDTEPTCSGGYCQFQAYGGPAATQSTCEAAYDGCDVEGTILNIPEADCAAGDLGFVCALAVVAGESGCPSGWWRIGSNCYNEFCVADCADCVTAVEGASAECGEDARCADGVTRTKLYGVWHPKEWIVDGYGIWHTGVWHAAFWNDGGRQAECSYAECVTYSHFQVIGTPGGTYFEETISIPSGYDSVLLCGDVDDDIKIDGSIIQENVFGTPNPSHGVAYTFTPSGSSFTIAVKDNYGANVSATLKICFYSSVGGLSIQGLQEGPGTELKNLLAKFGIHATPNCKCNKMAKKMNAWGPDESLKHIEDIVDVMEEEAKRRKLPFLRSLGRLLVRKAVRRSNSQ